MEGSMSAPPWSAWSCADVVQWLGAQGFGEHAELFAANKISGAILPELTRNALRDDLGIAAFGDRVRLSQALEALIATSSEAITSSSAPAPLTSTTTASSQPSPNWLPRDENALDLVVLHAAPLVIKDSRHRIYPMEKLDLEAERREISNSLLTDVQHKAIHVRFDIATADILRSLMTAWKCTVLHFSGHGLGQRAALCFEDGAGCTHLITPDALRQLMFSGDRQQQVPGAAPVEMETTGKSAAVPRPLDSNVQLVFVNACHSQKVASVFLNAGIPHVVAVHSDSLVVDASATMFAKHFYLSLFHGHTVSTAFEIAKGAVRALPTQKRAACCCA
uniref:SAM domain-containing protein n=1 Tax=Phytophthora ramorum TaxID=164328 RepID=H3GIZ3_PHYRM